MYELYINYSRADQQRHDLLTRAANERSLRAMRRGGRSAGLGHAPDRGKMQPTGAAPRGPGLPAGNLARRGVSHSGA
jgi:hypothetical protein